MNSEATLKEEQFREAFASFTLPAKERISEKTRRKKVIVIAGPTAIGKTEISFQIALAVGGEIISADSMQVYRGMDIGTAKPSFEMRQKVIHHLIDSRDLDENYNVVDFYQEATQALKEIFAKDHVPMVVGGTGFYISALLHGPPSGPPSVKEVRRQLQQEMESKGAFELHQKLKQLDPEYARTITPTDRHKIIRALEIITITNQRVSNFLPAFHHEDFVACDFRCWFLYLPNELLYERIDKRCDEMIERGLIEEVNLLAQEGLADNHTASQAIGYKQCLEYLKTDQTEADRKAFYQNFRQASRRYAKRQYTWFRKQPLFRWLNLSTLSKETVIEIIIQDLEQSFY
ncbi:MAG TPA: tRNA (adenosine(37)-N6)-dimethylallyltransferase MiaA [Parachlamydiales bacterium]|nr:tRNA (adenosine(37)-N6)-dimethylallyltransferase MiaA [Parachlamydiales bacterium]HCJ84106.1 tRNA (adenosine(37)-N6)-dimethylallyltransferase MiaA [Parachlamydiales bacterium]